MPIACDPRQIVVTSQGHTPQNLQRAHANGLSKGHAVLLSGLRTRLSEISAPKIEIVQVYFQLFQSITLPLVVPGPRELRMMKKFCYDKPPAPNLQILCATPCSLWSLVTTSVRENRKDKTKGTAITDACAHRLRVLTPMLCHVSVAGCHHL